jgi:hypothetical protein
MPGKPAGIWYPETRRGKLTHVRMIGGTSPLRTTCRSLEPDLSRRIPFFPCWTCTFAPNAARGRSAPSLDLGHSRSTLHACVEPRGADLFLRHPSPGNDPRRQLHSGQPDACGRDVQGKAKSTPSRAQQRSRGRLREDHRDSDRLAGHGRESPRQWAPKSRKWVRITPVFKMKDQA